MAQMLHYPKIKEVNVVEISSAMIDISKRYFSPLSYPDRDIWNDNRLSVINQDGRSYLEVVNKTYDIIISEPSNPWVDGIGSLFTVEFYQAVAKRLNPGGVASLWFHSYGLSCESVYSVLRAVSEVFSRLYVFKSSSNLFILASNSRTEFFLKPIPLEIPNLEKILFATVKTSNPGSIQSNVPLGKSGENRRIDNYLSLLKNQFLYDQDEVRNLTSFMTLNTDDNQFLQYESGKSFADDLFCLDYPDSKNPSTISKYWLPSSRFSGVSLSSQ